MRELMITIFANEIWNTPKHKHTHKSAQIMLKRLSILFPFCKLFVKWEIFFAKRTSEKQKKIEFMFIITSYYCLTMEKDRMSECHEARFIASFSFFRLIFAIYVCDTVAPTIVSTHTKNYYHHWNNNNWFFCAVIFQPSTTMTKMIDLHFVQSWDGLHTTHWNHLASQKC